MLLTLAMLSLLAVDEPSGGVALVLARRTALGPADASALQSQLSGALSEAGVPLLAPAEVRRRLARLGLDDATSCKGKAECLTELGRQLQVRWLVTISLSELDADRSVGLELLDVDAGLVVEREAVLLTPRTKLEAALFADLSRRVQAHLAPSAASPAELKAAPVPVPPPATGLLPMPQPAPRVQPSRVVLLSTGAALLAATVVLLTAGLVTRGRLSQGDRGADGLVRSTLSAGEARQLSRDASLELSAAGGAGLVALGLGTAVILTW